MLICAAVGSYLLRRNKIKKERERERGDRERQGERERAKSFYKDNKRLIEKVIIVNYPEVYVV